MAQTVVAEWWDFFFKELIYFRQSELTDVEFEELLTELLVPFMENAIEDSENIVVASNIDAGYILQRTPSGTAAFRGVPYGPKRFLVRLNQQDEDDPTVYDTWVNATDKVLTSVNYVSTGHYKFVFATALSSSILNIELVNRDFVDDDGVDRGKIRYMESASSTTEIHFLVQDPSGNLTNSLLEYQLVEILVK